MERPKRLPISGLVDNSPTILNSPEVKRLNNTRFMGALTSPVVNVASLLASPALSLLTYSPEAEASLVPAVSSLKGMKGVNKNYDLEAFLKAESSSAGASLSKALEKKYGITRTPEGLKTDISDAGFGFKPGAFKKIFDPATFKFSDIFEHPNQATIEHAVGRSLDDVTVTNSDLGYHGSYRPSSREVKLDVANIIRNPEARFAGPAVNIESVALHELNHDIQAGAKWQSGSSPAVAEAHDEFSKTVKTILTSPKPDKVIDQVLKERIPPKKLSQLTENEKAQHLNDLIAESVYNQMAGEQGANAVSRRHLLGVPSASIYDLMLPPSMQLYK